MFHILVVDDDKNTRRYLQAVLESENYGSITISVGWVAYTSAHVKASADASLQAALT